MSTQFRIITRSTEDWAQLSPETHAKLYLRKFSHMPKHGYEARYLRFMDNVERWNANWVPAYCQFRAQMVDLARRTWAATGIEVTDLSAYEFTEGEILLPTDDDDWFSPDIKQSLTPIFADPSVQLAVWRTWQLHANGSLCLDTSGARVSSNGYAVRAGHTTRRIVEHHAGVNEVDFTRIDLIGLSVWVRHVASWTRVSEPNIVLPRRPPVISGHGWMDEYVREHAEITGNLRAVKGE